MLFIIIYFYFYYHCITVLCGKRVWRQNHWGPLYFGLSLPPKYSTKYPQDVVQFIWGTRVAWVGHVRKGSISMLNGARKYTVRKKTKRKTTQKMKEQYQGIIRSSGVLMRKTKGVLASPQPLSSENKLLHLK